MKLPVFLLLEIAKDQRDLPFVDAVLYGAQMLLIGMLIVFAVLSLLWLLLELLGFVMRSAKTKPAVAPAPAPVFVPQAPAKTTDDSELIAVLSAAIAASESAPATRFRVVSFKRK